MLSTIIYFLPCFISLIWAITFSFKEKTQRQTLMMWIRFVGVIYYAAYALYTLPETDYDSMVRIETVSVPLSIALMVMKCMFVYLHLKPDYCLQPFHLVLLLPAVLLGTIVNMLYYILGFERTAQMIEILDSGSPLPTEYENEVWLLYSFFDETLINIVGAFIFLYLIITCLRILKKEKYRLGHICKFLFAGGTSTPSLLTAVLFIIFVISLVPLVGLGRKFMMEHQIFSTLFIVMMSVCMHLISHLEFFYHNDSSLTLHSLSHIKEESSMEDTGSYVAEGTHKPTKKDLQTEKVISLLENDEVFRQDDLSMQTLSMMSGLGRTTLSQIISDHYNEPFRNVVNTMRVKAVKKYIRENPAATLEEIARECGFKDASSLSHKFKELEGKTPLVWKSQSS